MKRTTKPKRNPREALLTQIARTLFTGKLLGQQYGGDRNLYDALGYPEVLSYEDYDAQYSRQDIAGAIVNRPAETTWKGGVMVSGPEGKDGELSKTWRKLWKDLKLKNKFTRIDKLATLGRFAVLYLGFNDSVGGNIDLEKEVSGKPSILYVTPFSEEMVTISEWETNPGNPRCGLPLIYTLSRIDDAGQNTQVFRVHHSRVLHITGETLESEVYGIPYLQRVFNRLMDLEKLTGGSAEMFWRGARPGMTGNVNPDWEAPDNLKDVLNDQMNEYDHGLRRILINQGVDMKSMETQISDPTSHVKVQIDMISAYTGIPARILLGSERGELASSQDRDTWVEFINTRRGEFAEPQIIIPFVEKLMSLGILPDTEEYNIEWEDLADVSEEYRAKVGLVYTQALSAYGNSTAAAEIIPPEEFMKFILNLPESTIEAIIAAREKYLKEMEAQEEEERQLIEEGLLPNPNNPQEPIEEETEITEE